MLEKSTRAQDAGRSVDRAQECLSHLGSILGLTFKAPGPVAEGQLNVKPFIDLLLETRAQLRQAKQFDLADQIRQGLDHQGVLLEDTPEGTHWQYRPRQ